jgi:hypothetical protein
MPEKKNSSDLKCITDRIEPLNHKNNNKPKSKISD